MSQQTYSHEFSNGLTLLAEQMDWLESAAFALLLPAGCLYEDPSELGLGTLTCEMVQRGSGTRDSRQFIADLENLGADTSANVSNAHTSFGGAMPAESLLKVLEIYADAVQRPHLPEDQLDDAKAGCIHEVHSIEDDLAQRCMIAARRRFYADPFGRASHGTVETIERQSSADIKRFFQTAYRPQNAILAVAGKIDWPQLKDHVAKLFAGWSSSSSMTIQETPPARGYEHIDADSQQVHLSVGFDAPPYPNLDYFQIRGAIGVLSDGMSSRLFTEVREKRGLCYTVFASCHSLKDRGGVFAYAGTTAERAQETLDVLMAEIIRLHAGITEDEISRLKRRIKRALIIQQESSSARAGSLANDWYYLQRIRPVEELRQIIDGLTHHSINQYLAAHRPHDFSIVTLGKKPLETSHGVS